MAISFGRITVAQAGVPVRVSSKTLKCHAIMIEALPTNTGKAYIGDKTLVKGSTGEFAILAIPTANTIPVYSETISPAPDALNLFDYWIDVDVNGEGVLVSYVVW
jgi:hypothetical protein